MGTLQVTNERQTATPESVLPDSNLGTYNLGITPSTRGVSDHATNIDDVRRPAKIMDRHFRF
jgi:hypothetical protein